MTLPLFRTLVASVRQADTQAVRHTVWNMGSWGLFECKSDSLTARQPKRSQKVKRQLSATDGSNQMREAYCQLSRLKKRQIDH